MKNIKSVIALALMTIITLASVGVTAIVTNGHIIESNTKVNTYVSFCYGAHYENSGKVYNELLDENVDIWQVKDEVITNAKYCVIFSNMGTPSIYDDMIVDFYQIPEDF